MASMSFEEHSEQNSNTDIVFVGAGPVGLWTAIQTKLRNPKLHIVMYEKHEQYQRLHTLQMNKNSFKGIPDDKRLHDIVKGFSTHVKTSEIEGQFKSYAQDLGIEFRYETVEGCEDFAQQFPENTVIVGADGSHSVVRNEIFGNKLQYKQDMQYVAEYKYFVKGSTTKLNPIFEGIPVMTHSKFTVSETVGKEKDGMTPVTLRFFIDKKTFNQLRGEDKKGATFKNPFRYNDLNASNFPRDLAKSMKAWIQWRKKIKHEERIEFESDAINGEKITAINLEVYASEEFVKEEHGKIWVLVGDAAAGFPYFRALNAGLLCGTQLASALSEHFSSDNLSQHQSSSVKLDDYKAYVQARVNKEKRNAGIKNKALNVGRFVVDTCVDGNHLSRAKLAMVDDEKPLDVKTILTFYLLENYEGLFDGPKYHELADYFKEDDLLSHAQEFAEHLDAAYKDAKLNLGGDFNEEKMNVVANTFKANIYKEIYNRQLELRDSRWKTAWIMSVVGLALPIISHIIIWSWYLHRRTHEPLTLTTLNPRIFSKIYENENSFESTTQILNRLNTTKSPVRDKNDELRARRVFIPVLYEKLENANHENSIDVKLVEDDLYNISSVQVISTNWNRQAKRFDQKLAENDDSVLDESLCIYSTL